VEHQLGLITAPEDHTLGTRTNQTHEESSKSVFLDQRQEIGSPPDLSGAGPRSPQLQVPTFSGETSIAPNLCRRGTAGADGRAIRTTSRRFANSAIYVTSNTAAKRITRLFGRATDELPQQSTRFPSYDAGSPTMGSSHAHILLRGACTRAIPFIFRVVAII
jgi:hypothetical protein